MVSHFEVKDDVKNDQLAGTIVEIIITLNNYDIDN